MAERLISEAFCPRFHRAAELVGRRWTGAIIRALLHGVCRFSDLEQTIPGLSGRMLSERLKELEAEGLVSRSVLPETPVRVEYRLTAKGQALVPVIQALTAWAHDWVPELPGEHDADSPPATAPPAAKRKSPR